MAASDFQPRSDPGARSPAWLEAAALGERLEEEVARAERHGTQLSCLLVVVEGLPEMQRRYGSGLGEQALSHLARALRGQLRRFDQVGRPSERELLVVLPGADSTRAEIVARRSLGRLRTIKIEADGERRGLRIAIGLAAWSSGLSAAQLLQAAREAAGAEREPEEEVEGQHGEHAGDEGATRPSAHSA